MKIIIVLIIPLFLFSVNIFAAYTAAFPWDIDTGGWYTIQAKNCVAAISVDPVQKIIKDSKGSFKFNFRYTGAGSYLGIQTQLQFTQIPADWSYMGYGSMVVYCKGSSRFNTSIIILTKDGPGYSADIEVFPYWVKYIIPWTSFRDGESKYDPFSQPVDRLEIRPGYNGMDDKIYTFYMDELGFETDPVEIKADREIPVTGTVRNGSEKPLSSKVKVAYLQDVERFFGINEIDSTTMLKNGNYKVASVIPGERYKMEILEKEKAAEYEKVNPPSVPFQPVSYLKVDAAGYKSQLQIVDISSSKGIDFKLVPVNKEKADVTVDDKTFIRPINKLLYGVNLGVWAISSRILQPEFIKACKDAGMTYVRAPGGGISQGFRWSFTNMVWCENPGAPYRGVVTARILDDLNLFLKGIGAEGMFTVNMETTNRQNVYNIMNYANLQKKCPIKYWELGNEPDGAQIHFGGKGPNWGHDPDSLRATYTTVGKLYLEFADYIKKIDPTVKVLGAVCANADFYDIALPAFMKVVGNKLDVLSIHRYPQNDDILNITAHFSDAKLLNQPIEWRDFQLKFDAWDSAYMKDGYRPLRAVTEWNTCYANPGPRQLQLVGALYTAKNILEMAYTGIDQANYWDLIGTGTYSMLGWRGSKLIKSPVYYAFKIIARNFQGQIVKVDSSTSFLPSYAAKNGNELNIIVINTSPVTTYSCFLHFPEYSDKYMRYQLTETESYTETALAFPPNSEVEYPPYSITLLKLQKKGAR